MATVAEKTLSWLYSVLSREYQHPDRAYSDLAQLLSQHPGFAPRTDVYTYETGASTLLLHLQGTIPVSFRGQTYRFPIEVWIPHAYPYEAPMVYVTPTEDMLVRPGQHVDGAGKFYHHYLAQWRDHWDRSNLLELFSILSTTFAREPPVMSKQQMQIMRPPTQHPAQQAPPVPPPPIGMQAPPTRALTSSSTMGKRAPPRPPPKEAVFSSSSTSQQSPGMSRYDAPPPLPSKPYTPESTESSAYVRQNGSVIDSSTSLQQMPQRNSSLRQPISPQQYQQYQQSTPNPQQYQPMPQQRPPSQNPGPPPLPQPQQPSAMYNNAHQPPTAQQYSLQQPQHYLTQPARQPLPPTQPQPRQNQPPNKPPPIDLLDSTPSYLSAATESHHPAPPVPPNPQKDALLSHLSHILTSTLHTSISQNTSALPSLSAQHFALQNTQRNLTTELTHLSTFLGTLSSNNAILTHSLSSATKTITSASHRLKHNDLPTVDEMLVAPTVVGKQLYDVVCEERGIEAGIWALQEGFVRGRVGVEVWSRKTRELAREGFRKRWIRQKIAAGMGLEG